MKLRIFIASMIFSAFTVACGTEDESTNDTGTTTTNDTASLDGASLYASNCASCHGSLSFSDLASPSATDITNAISSVDQMGGIDLTEAEITAISEALQ